MAALAGRQAEFFALFIGFVTGVGVLNARFSPAEPALIEDFRNRAADIPQATAAALSAPESAGPAS